MKKIGSIYSRTFNAHNLLVSKYENGIIKSECWNISIELRCADALPLEYVTMQGLSLEDWLQSLFGQKLLAIEETEYLSHFTNVLYVNKFDEAYIVSLIEMILTPNMQEAIHIQSIDLVIK